MPPADCVFCDAVQLAGRTACDVSALGADALALSAHKLGGPKGAGAIAAASASFSLGEPLIRGGGQERGARAGTENVAAIAGFGAAARACGGALAEEEARLLALRDRLGDAVRDAAPDAVVFGETARRLPNTLCFAVPGVDAATLMIALDLAGVAASSGSACSSGKVTPSHVLSAMGVRPELARCSDPVELGMDVVGERHRALRRSVRRRVGPDAVRANGRGAVIGGRARACISRTPGVEGAFASRFPGPF